MNRLGKIAVGLAGGLALHVGWCAPNPAAAHNPPMPGPAAIPNPSPHNSMIPTANNPSSDNPLLDNPYAAIAARNVFGLVPPASTIDTNALILASLPKITPQGIMGVYGNYQVLFKVTPAKPGPGDKEEDYILSEGQRQDDIEVIKIDNEKSLVTFNNHGKIQELPLVETAASSGAAPAARGGVNPAMAPGASGGGGSAPGTIIRFGANAANNGGRPANGAPGFNGAPGSNGEAATAADGGLNFGGSTEGRIYQPPASNLTPEQAQLLLVAQHLNAITKHDPTAPLFPPSAIDKEAGIDNGNGGQ
jgi:hypothetical protein